MDKRYKMRWTADNGDMYLLEISHSSRDEVVELTPGKNPFVTMQDSDSNPFIPIRNESATISFIIDEDFEINVPNGHYFKVYLDQVDDRGAIIVNKWLGYLKGESLSQQWTREKHDVTLNAVGVLTSLSTFKLHPTRDYGLYALHELIDECLNNILSQHRTIVLPMDTKLTSQTSTDAFDILNMQVGRLNFLKDDSGSIVVLEDCLTVLSKILKFLGWSAEYRNETVYFRSFGCEKYYKVQNERGSQTISEIEMTESDAPKPTAVYHMITVEPGKSSVTVLPKRVEADYDLPTIPFDECKYAGKFKDAINMYVDTTTYFLYRLYYKSDSEEIECHNYDVFAGARFDEKTPYDAYEMTQDGDYKTDCFCGLVRADVYPIEEDPSQGGHKINYSLDEYLMLRCVNNTSTLPQDILEGPLACRIRPKKRYRLEAGSAIALSFSFINLFAQHEMSKIKILIDFCGRQFGGEIPLENGKVKTVGKSLDDPYTYNGYLIPINETLEGYFDIKIYYTFETYEVEQPWPVTRVTGTNMLIKDFELVYVNNEYDDIYERRKIESKKYTKYIDGWADSDETVDIDLYSGEGNKEHYGVVYEHTYKQTPEGGVKEGDYPVEKVYFSEDGETYESMAPEEALLKKYVAHFSKCRNVLTVNAHTPEQIDTYNRHYLTLEGKKYMVISTNNVNWRTNTCELILKDYD